MKQSQRQRGKARFIGSTILFVWGGALAPWAAITGLGRSGEWVRKAWSVIFGRISWLEKMSQVCFASLHEHGYVSNTTPVFLPVLK